MSQIAIVNMTEATKQGHQFPPPPIFGSSRPMNEDRIPHTGSICLDDIFDEFLFSGDRQSNASASTKVFDQYGKYTDNEDYFDDSGDDSGDEDSKKRKRSRNQHRNMTEHQKVERRYSVTLDF